MTFTIWKFITNFITGPLIWVWFFNQVLDPKYKQKQVLLLQVVLFGVVIAGAFFISDNVLLKMGISIIGDLLILHFFFRNHLGRKFFAEIICKLCYAGTEIITSIWVPLVFGAPFLQAVYSGKYDPQIYLVFNPLMLLLCFLFVLIIKRTTYGFQWSDFLQFSVFPLSQLILILLIAYLTLFFDSVVKIPLFTVVLVIGIGICLAADIFLVRFMKGISEKARLETENKYLQQLQDIQYEHYQALKKQQNYIRGLKHDIINHIQTVEILLQNGDHLEAERFNQSLKREFMQNTAADFCENPIVDAVLHHKIEYANSLRIKTSVNVSMAKDTGISEVDLLRVFSNLLDNAIEGCQADQDGADKCMDIGAKCQAGYLVIKVENSKSQKQRGIESRKKDRALHGQGLRIIEQITKKYEGTFQYEDRGTVFEVIASLQIRSGIEYI